MTPRAFHTRSAAQLRLASSMLQNAAVYASSDGGQPAAVALIEQALDLIAQSYPPSIPIDPQAAAWARLLRDRAAF